MTNNPVERDLISQIKLGDTKAYAIFIDRYKDLVFSLALKMLNNREEAEEVAQDSFIKAIKSIGCFKGKSKLSTWLYKIVYYQCLDRIKANKRQLNTYQMSDRLDISDRDALSAIELMERKDLKNSINDCFKALSASDSFLLTLFYFEEQSMEEIAQIFEITPNNVKIKLFRARKRLSVVFKNQLEPEILANYERAQ